MALILESFAKSQEKQTTLSWLPSTEIIPLEVDTAFATSDSAKVVFDL